METSKKRRENEDVPMIIMMPAWRVRGGWDSGIQTRQFMNNTCGLKLVLLFPIFSANGSPDGESELSRRHPGRGLVHYYPDSGPHKNVAIHRQPRSRQEKHSVSSIPRGYNIQYSDRSIPVGKVCSEKQRNAHSLFILSACAVIC